GWCLLVQWPTRRLTQRRLMQQRLAQPWRRRGPLRWMLAWTVRPEETMPSPSQDLTLLPKSKLRPLGLRRGQQSPPPPTARRARRPQLTAARAPVPRLAVAPAPPPELAAG
ncbi:unnamed protein product, partial [Phaeothamnion confervicola]